MSKYTTEIRFICETACNLTESKGYSDVNTIIEKSIPVIFNFNFPIFDENYRFILEKKILKHFYTREIGQETVGLWKLRLDTKLNEIMPYYNKLYNSELLEFNPLYTVNINKKTKTNTNNNKKENENINDKTNNNGKMNSTTKAENNNTTNDTNIDLYSDTPQGAITNLENETYLTNARKITNSATSKNNSNNISAITNTENNTYNRTRKNENALLSIEDYLEDVSGYSGTSGSELILKYRETFLNIDMMIINDLEELFIQLW